MSHIFESMVTQLVSWDIRSDPNTTVSNLPPLLMRALSVNRPTVTTVPLPSSS